MYKTYICFRRLTFEIKDLFLLARFVVGENRRLQSIPWSVNNIAPHICCCVPCVGNVKYGRILM